LPFRLAAPGSLPILVDCRQFDGRVFTLEVPMDITVAGAQAMIAACMPHGAVHKLFVGAGQVPTRERIDNIPIQSVEPDKKLKDLPRGTPDPPVVYPAPDPNTCPLCGKNLVLGYTRLLDPSLKSEIGQTYYRIADGAKMLVFGRGSLTSYGGAALYASEGRFQCGKCWEQELGVSAFRAAATKTALVAEVVSAEVAARPRDVQNSE